MSEPTKNIFDQLLDAFRQVVREEIAAALANGDHGSEPDRLLTPEEAAKLMNVNEAWLYRHAKQLPFAKKLSRKSLRFNEAGLRRWMAARK
jgi:excisionase family DNA binding protein